ncbi:MAG: hypothetical protein OEL20_10070 [Sulfuritalea sp.]|nr:hypothetical protein [Sulfuritalea sp.]
MDAHDFELRFFGPYRATHFPADTGGAISASHDDNPANGIARLRDKPGCGAVYTQSLMRRSGRYEKHCSMLVSQ